MYKKASRFNQHLVETGRGPLREHSAKPDAPKKRKKKRKRRAVGDAQALLAIREILARGTRTKK